MQPAQLSVTIPSKANPFMQRMSPASSPRVMRGPTVGMLEGPIVPALLKLAAPTLIVLVVQTLVSVAETYFVGFPRRGPIDANDPYRSSKFEIAVMQNALSGVFPAKRTTLPPVPHGPP